MALDLELRHTKTGAWRYVDRKHYLANEAEFSSQGFVMASRGSPPRGASPPRPQPTVVRPQPALAPALPISTMQRISVELIAQVAVRRELWSRVADYPRLAAVAYQLGEVIGDDSPTAEKMVSTAAQVPALERRRIEVAATAECIEGICNRARARGLTELFQVMSGL